jgi:hypothetical protein
MWSKGILITLRSKHYGTHAAPPLQMHLIEAWCGGSSEYLSVAFVSAVRLLDMTFRSRFAVLPPVVLSIIPGHAAAGTTPVARWMISA